MAMSTLHFGFHISGNYMRFLNVDKDVGKQILILCGGVNTLGDNLAKVLEYTYD